MLTFKFVIAVLWSFAEHGPLVVPRFAGLIRVQIRLRVCSLLKVKHEIYVSFGAQLGVLVRDYNNTRIELLNVNVIRKPHNL